MLPQVGERTTSASQSSGMRSGTTGSESTSATPLSSRSRAGAGRIRHGLPAGRPDLPGVRGAGAACPAGRLASPEATGGEYGIVHVGAVASSDLRIAIEIDGRQEEVGLTGFHGSNAPDKPLRKVGNLGDCDDSCAAAVEWTWRKPALQPAVLALHSPGELRHEQRDALPGARDAPFIHTMRTIHDFAALGTSCLTGDLSQVIRQHLARNPRQDETHFFRSVDLHPRSTMRSNWRRIPPALPPRTRETGARRTDLPRAAQRDERYRQDCPDRLLGGRREIPFDEAARYQLSQELLLAINMPRPGGSPLLLIGKPGTGKARSCRSTSSTRHHATCPTTCCTNSTTAASRIVSTSGRWPNQRADGRRS